MPLIWCNTPLCLSSLSSAGRQQQDKVDKQNGALHQIKGAGNHPGYETARKDYSSASTWVKDKTCHGVSYALRSPPAMVDEILQACITVKLQQEGKGSNGMVKNVSVSLML